MEQTRQLKDGHLIPTIGLGTWKIADNEAKQTVRSALQAGYRHFDCAFVYANEGPIGCALKEEMESGTVHRKDLFITSKLWNTFHRPELVREGCLRSLKNLQLDYLDLYLMHWPASYEPSDELFPKREDGSILYDNVPPEETWKAMEELVSMGLVKSIGLSNFNQSQIRRILECAHVQPVVLQVESHLGFLNQEVIDFAKSVGMVVIAYSPLGSASDQSTGGNLLELPAVQEMCKKYGKTAGQILLRHAVQRGLCAVPKSSTHGRILENIGIFDFVLSPDDMDKLNAAGGNSRRIRPPLMVNHPEFPFKELLG
ncbi:hypothetical protein CRM22_010631 [Opisthorchis felineus]|uniref:NADP-dependent oxidoreductase domain-containing protein n=3 Tax=Opisthorchis felineus TaxID=147828 RepID=A0A4S2KR50_OPIFE|nr:hypothetical protein CRM22_010631 [Opisthorchis felineus]